MHNHIKHLFFLTLITTLNINKTLGQNKQFELNQEVNFNKLLSEKQSVNNSFSIYKNFSIQLYHQEKEEIENKYYEFKKKYPNIEATIIYADPKYKLIIGNYRNKIDAERNLKILKKQYPEAFIVRLTK